MEVTSRIVNRKFTHYAREAILKAMERFEGKEVAITIKEFKPTRSNKQNKYMSVIYILAGKAFEDAHGGVWSRDRTKYELKISVGHCVEYTGLDGTVRKEELPTPKMGTAEFSTLVNKMRHICYEYMGVDINSPDGIPYSHELGNF